MLLFKSMGGLTPSVEPRLGLHFTSFLFYNMLCTLQRITDVLKTIFFCDENAFTSFCLLYGNSFSLGNFPKQIICCPAHPKRTNTVSGSTQEKMLNRALLGTPIQAIVVFFSSLAKQIRLPHLFSQMVFLVS